MDEKVIIKGSFEKWKDVMKKIMLISAAIAATCVIFGIISAIIGYHNVIENVAELYKIRNGKFNYRGDTFNSIYGFIEAYAADNYLYTNYASIGSYIISGSAFFNGIFWFILNWIALYVCANAALFFWFLSVAKLIVTDKRVFYHTILGINISLPMDSVTFVGTSWLHGMYFGTSSKKVNIWFMDNNKAVSVETLKLIIEREKQNQAKAV